MHQKDEFMFRSRICRSDFETYIVLATDFAQCDMTDVTILHVLCIEKKHCVLCHQFQRGVVFRKLQCGDPQHRITLCEIIGIKTDNNDGFIINTDIVLN